MIGEEWHERVIAASLEATRCVEPIFRDRKDGGERLAEEIAARGYHRPVFAAVPTGGIPVAVPIMERLGAPLHLVYAAKMPISHDHRFGIGAATLEEAIFNQEALEVFQLRPNHPLVEEGIRYARERVGRMRAALEGQAPPLPTLEGRTVIIVDDGIATGYTALAAARSLARLHPQGIVVGSPVASIGACAMLESRGIECIAPYRRSVILVDSIYQSFPELSFDDARIAISTGTAGLRPGRRGYVDGSG